ncbi:bile acid beta-glucosidase [Oxynema sp. CENA135]|uniref:GH116 family glycosyl hydrolase n=1 Tax=Oxynema sp. CENA135 TaxID=984206 RepID=UPI00190D0F72|nr:GH116 family glycosyl hydrolase [Oxynema sp. CENA135]MBK4729580.1 bile acid beta-glucosidase [Oxynema sp. CENA135]
MSNRDNRPPIPSYTWTRPLGLGWDKPYTVRYASNLDDGPWHGMPLGGFGAGCIGRSPRGDFNLWHLDGGEHLFQCLPACQFSVYEESAHRRQAYALATAPPEDGTLSAWQWYPQSTPERSTGTYHALYPRSWFVYEGVFDSQLTCEQFSPIWPGKYQECSYPISVFEWTAHNPTDEPITLSILLTWQNTVGWFTNAIKSPQIKVRDDGSPVYDYRSRWGESQGNFNRYIEDFHRVGYVMGGPMVGDEPQEGEGEWAIATVTSPVVEIFHHGRWNPVGDGSEIWEHFSRDGSLDDFADERPARSDEQIGVAIAVRFTVRPGKTRKIPFILAWDLPITEFSPDICYYRRYTDFFGRHGRGSWSMVRTALKHYDMWRENIVAWQEAIGDRPDLSPAFKMALFNELYLLADGGTLWTAQDEQNPRGQFAVLECIDYRWYESLDVRLYGSFGLLMLWPELEKSILLAFARAIPTADETPRKIGYNQADAVRKIADATPHDLGAPNEHPWVKTNYTSYQDCNLWKDLACDFVLQVYRDFQLTGADDFEFLWDCWPSVVRALRYLKQFDRDGDGIPENSGAPDQTFDDWRLRGISAYCGGLWLAALEAAIAIGELLLKHPYDNGIFSGTIYEERRSPLSEPDGIQAAIATYREWLEQARPLYRETLWNGEYYRLDSESGSDVVMADQLCGQFYARLLGLDDLVPVESIRTTLETIYRSCFLNFHDGQFGAANGVRPDGSAVNPQDTHPLEVWTGINFGLAAFLLQMGMKEEAFRLSETVIGQIYENGLQFRTPEAITAVGTFRASHYLRAMAIWAIYGVLTEFDRR